MKAFMVAITIFLTAGNAWAYPVAYNTETGKYHSMGCRWAKKCTKNCIAVDHKEAISDGGIPCKVCGGK